MSHFRILGVSLLACSAGLLAWLSPAGTGVARAAAKDACTADVPLRWEILDKYVDGITANAIQDDRVSPVDPPRPYVDGVDEVKTWMAVCGGTYNVNLYVRYMSGGTRQAFIGFKDRLVASTDYTPGWTAIKDKLGCEGENGCWMFGIQNIKYLPLGKTLFDEYEFTTRMGGHGPSYSKLSFFNPST